MTLTPYTIWGWAGLAVLAFLIFSINRLSLIGLALGAGLFYFLYVYMDETNAPATS